MKKNVTIILLLLAIALLAYLLFSRATTPTGNYDYSPSSQQSRGYTENSSRTLDLSGRGLSHVSRDIFNDSSVTTLDVSNNKLTGALPAEVRKLASLEVLIASNNNLTGIPAEVGQLRSLKTIDFANNNISGLPMELGNLNKLETLNLRGNPNISKQDLEKIRARLPNTKILAD